MSNAVAKQIEQPAALAVMTPMDMLEKAVSSGAGIEVITKLMDLQDRWAATQARREFDEAIAAAKAEIPPIVRNATGHNSKKYADFAAIATVVDPIISKFGLSYRFRTTQTERIAVTCVLSHKAGHSEETTLAGPSDTTGNKNPIQAIGSTLTYLQRYSLVQALGLAATNDDDGKAGGANVISQDQVGELTAMLESVGADKVRFLKYFKVEKLADLPENSYADAVKLLNAKVRK